jgi:hypothetical protein
MPEKEKHMKNRLRFFVVILTLVGVTLACNMPAANRQVVGNITATPNKTMTALFESGLLGSLTPDPTWPPIPSVTPVPADTSVPVVPTNTNVPALPTADILPTNTSIPAVIPTLTAPPTLTAAPATATPLPTKVLTRPGPQVKAFYLSKPPVLDGVWDEWTTAAYPAAQVVFGRDQWTGKDDLEASFRLGWDENNLYIAAKIFDDVYVQNATGKDLFLGDSLEILFDRDLLGDFHNAGLTNDDYQLGISTGNPDVNGTKEAYLWYPSNIAGPRPDVKIAAVRSGGVTRVEVAIPWGTLGVNPAVNQRYGFAISFSDNDTPGTQRQESMVSNVRGRVLTDPTTWGELLLVK